MPTKEEAIRKVHDLIDKLCESDNRKQTLHFSINENGTPMYSLTEKKERISESIRKLYNDMDACIGEIVSARIKKDEHAEGRVIFKMESLFVGAMQELSFLHDYFQL